MSTGGNWYWSSRSATTVMSSGSLFFANFSMVRRTSSCLVPASLCNYSGCVGVSASLRRAYRLLTACPPSSTAPSSNCVGVCHSPHWGKLYLSRVEGLCGLCPHCSCVGMNSAKELPLLFEGYAVFEAFLYKICL